MSSLCKVQLNLWLSLCVFLISTKQSKQKMTLICFLVLVLIWSCFLKHTFVFFFPKRLGMLTCCWGFWGFQFSVFKGGTFTLSLIFLFINLRCCMLWLKSYPCISLNIHNSFKFWATAITFHDFISISFLHMLTRNQVHWWNDNFEKLPQSQHGESFTLWKSWVNFHPLCTQCISSSLKVWVNLNPQCMRRTFFFFVFVCFSGILWGLTGLLMFSLSRGYLHLPPVLDFLWGYFHPLFRVGGSHFMSVQNCQPFTRLEWTKSWV